MLRLYYGRENVDKDRFLFHEVKRTLSAMGGYFAEGSQAGETSFHDGPPHGRRPCETQPHEPVPGETQPHEPVPCETQPHEPVPGEMQPHEPVPCETQPHEPVPGETQPHQPVPGEAQPAPSGNAGPAKRVLLVVPDQFTLQAEQNAFAFLDVPGLMDLEVLSQTRLGFRVLSQEGGQTRLHIDKYGRHMVLAGIVRDMEEELLAYRGVKKSGSFIELANDLITEMKQNNADPQRLLAVMEQLEPDSLLYRKLSDIRQIYARYEEALAGKYIDTEDYMALVISKLPQSHLVRDSEIWIYGFDSFTEKSLQMIGVLMKCAVRVNVIMTGDPDASRDGGLFELTDRVLCRLSRMAEEAGVSWKRQAIPDTYRIPVAPMEKAQAQQEAGVQAGKPDSEAAQAGAIGSRTPALAHLERELYAYPHEIYSGAEVRSLRFCRAANLYAEVETAAARIVELTREKGLSCGDIAVICNDLEKYGSIIKRIFALYDIPVFLDEKRAVLHDPAVELVSALLDVVTKGWQQQDLFRLMKTGLYGVSPEECGDLENYAIKYRIRGKRWKSDFEYGLSEYGEEGLKGLNELRQRICAPLIRFEEAFGRGKTAREKSVALYHTLAEDLKLPTRLEKLLSCLNERKELLAAEEISQIWSVILGLLDQMTELAGEERISGQDYELMLDAGFSAVEIGLLPPSLDQVIVGTMQRTRRGRVKAMLILGANDGLIPAAGGKEDLLSETEKSVLSEKEIVLCKNDDYRAWEEQLAIYKNLCKPEEYLWISYSVSDTDGREKKPSLIFNKLTEIFPTAAMEKDVVNLEDDLERIQGKRAALPHMSDAFRRKLSGESRDISLVWKLAYNQMSLMEGRDTLVRRQKWQEQLNKAAESAADNAPARALNNTPESASDNATARALNKAAESAPDNTTARALNNTPDAACPDPGEAAEYREWQGLRALRQGLFFTNRVKRLNDRLVNRLYKQEGIEDFVLSPSRLERFGKCPFSHLVQYGMRPEERRVFEVAGREVGDVYHQCLMELSQEMTVADLPLNHPDSPWMCWPRQTCEEKVSQIIDRISRDYREGVLKQGGEEEYRSARMKKIAGQAAWAMISHVRQGAIRRVYFEAGFGQGRDKPFPPIVITVGSQKIRIEGKIDRVDILPGGRKQDGEPAAGAEDRCVEDRPAENRLTEETMEENWAGKSAANAQDLFTENGALAAEDYVKIVDYKSGSERFDMEEAREGTRLQLMLYLEGALGGVRRGKPAGVFYFEIGEPMVDASDYPADELGEKVADQIRKSFKMDGIMVDEPAVIEGIAGEFTGFSDIVPLRKGSKGVTGSGEGRILSGQSFDAFRREVKETVDKLCRDFLSGSAEIHPKKTKNQNACKYCMFKGICCFDLAFEDCKFR